MRRGGRLRQRIDRSVRAQLCAEFSLFVLRRWTCRSVAQHARNLGRKLRFMRRSCATRKSARRSVLRGRTIDQRRRRLRPRGCLLPRNTATVSTSSLEARSRRHRKALRDCAAPRPPWTLARVHSDLEISRTTRSSSPRTLCRGRADIAGSAPAPREPRQAHRSDTDSVASRISARRCAPVLRFLRSGSGGSPGDLRPSGIRLRTAQQVAQLRHRTTVTASGFRLFGSRESGL
jgi:hypothetical protein